MQVRALYKSTDYLPVDQVWCKYPKDAFDCKNAGKSTMHHDMQQCSAGTDKIHQKTFQKGEISRKGNTAHHDKNQQSADTCKSKHLDTSK